MYKYGDRVNDIIFVLKRLDYMPSCNIRKQSQLSGGAESLQCLLKDGTSCPSRLCPNTTVVYSCPLPPLGSQLGYSVWNFSRMAGNCSIAKISLRQPTIFGCSYNQSQQCGQYTASFYIGPCITSSLRVIVGQNLGGVIINCLNYDSIYGTTEDLETTTLTVAPGKCSDN